MSKKFGGVFAKFLGPANFQNYFSIEKSMELVHGP
jgi:hypothetical protein